MFASTRPGASVAALLVLGFCTQSTSAVGFRLPEISIAGLGLSNAVVADSGTSGAMAYNPAVMGFQDDNTLVAGVMNVHPDISVKPDGGSATDSDGDKNILAPNVYYLHRFNDDVSAGIGINAPFGLETKWPAGTFPTFASVATALSNPAIAALEPEHSAIRMVNINPNLAYEIGDNTSVAIGIDYYLVKELVFNTQGIEIKGDGKGTGWNVGLLHQRGDWGFGVAYRSKVTADVDGTVDATALGSTQSDAEAELNFPGMLQVGAHYQFNDQVAVEFDIERTGWSSFDVIEIDHSSPGLSNPITSTNEWEDTTAYRLGASVRVSDNTQLRLGYGRENSPSNGDYLSARMPTTDLQTFSVGFAHNVGRATIEAGYMYVLFDKLDHNAAANSYLTQIVSSSGSNTEPNGTDAYNGEYDTTAHLVGIGVSMVF